MNAYKFNQPIDSSGSHWDVSGVENMNSMFRGAKEFNQPIGRWNLWVGRSMADMFNGATNFNQPINTYTQPITLNGNTYKPWSVDYVLNMSNMFKDTSFNQPINRWETTRVKDMRAMFWGASKFNQPIDTSGSRWDVSSVTNMGTMFDSCLLYTSPSPRDA